MFEVKVFEDNSFYIKRKCKNNFEGNIKKENWIRKQKNENMPFMSKEKYIKALKRYKRKLCEVKIDAEKCLFLSLGTNIEMSFKTITANLNKFIKAVKNKFGKVQYIRSIECYENGYDRYHVHLILIFDEKKVVPEQSWLKKHWIYGTVFVEHLWKNYEDGLKNYICAYDGNCIQKENPDYTKYPVFTKIVCTSNNLGMKETKTLFESDYSFVNSVLTNCKEIDNNAKYSKSYHLYNGKHYLDDCLVYNAENLCQILIDSNLNNEEKKS